MRKFVVIVLSALSLGASSSSDAADTVIREAEFSVTLPGNWSGGYDVASRTWSYRTPQQTEGFTVGILRRTNGSQSELIKADFDNYLRVRREQELQLGGSGFTLSESKTQTQYGAYIARFEGSDKLTRRRTRTVVIVNRTLAASFYYEAMASSDKDFARSASAIFSQVGLVQ